MDWQCLENVNGFSKEMANLLALASLDAYAPFNRRSKEYLEQKWDCPVHQIQVEETQLIVIDGPQLLIAFRGTEPGKIKDWVSDLDISTESWGDGNLAHGGFSRAYSLVRNKVREHAKLARGHGVFLAGHSLGGALATLAIWDLETDNSPVKRCYTFGAPRVFCSNMAQEFRNRFSGKLFRVVNRNDIVPRVPFWVRFRHTGSVAYINRFDRIQNNPGLGYITYDRILGYRANIFRSHMMYHYIKGTENAG